MGYLMKYTYGDLPLLTGVTSLYLSFSKQKAKSKRKLRNSIAKAFSMTVPNLKELNLDDVETTNTILEAFLMNCPQLEVLHLARSNSFNANNYQCMEECGWNNLKELYLDSSTLMCDCWYSPENFEGYCILLVK